MEQRICSIALSHEAQHAIDSVYKILERSGIESDELARPEILERSGIECERKFFVVRTMLRATF